ncbi:unnamed protein product, partial [Laminaria digitata]
LTDKYERTKRIVILGYVMTVSLLLWGMSNTDMTSYSEVSFFRFVMFFWAGGFAFHYLSILLSISATEENWSHWKGLSFRLLVILLVIMGTIWSIILSWKLVSYTGLPEIIFPFIGVGLFGVGIWLSMAAARQFGQALEQLQESS